MFNALIILTAVINLANSQDNPEVDDLAILSGLATSTLECSLRFDHDFVESNEEIAAAIEALLGEREETDVTREPRRRRDSSEDSEDTGAPESEGETRRALGGRRGRRGDVTREPLADGATREPRGDRTREPRDGTNEPHRRRRDDDSTHEPCDDDEADVTDEAGATEAPVQLRRLLGGRGRGGRRGRDRDADVTGEPLADDATRAPRSDRTREPRDNDSTREPCDDESEATETPIQARRNLGQRRGRGGDATGEPRADGVTREPRSERTREPRRRRGDDSTREPCDDDEADATGEADATEAPVQLRRLLGGRGRGRHRPGRDTDGVTREPRGDRTREPRDSTKEPCEGEECARHQRRDSESSDDEAGATEVPVELRRQLGGRGRGRRGSDRDAEATREPRGDRTREPRDEDSTREPCDDDSTREPRRRRKETEEPEEMQRRALKRGNGRGRRGRGRELDAQIVDGHIDISGVEGEVVFGEYDEASESTPLTLTVGETTFHCEVEVNRKGGVSCRAVSEDDFQVHVDCEAVADDELESN